MKLRTVALGAVFRLGGAVAVWVIIPQTPTRLGLPVRTADQARPPFNHPKVGIDGIHEVWTWYRDLPFREPPIGMHKNRPLYSFPKGHLGAVLADLCGRWENPHLINAVMSADTS